MNARWISDSSCPAALVLLHWILNEFLMIGHSKENATPLEQSSNSIGRLEIVGCRACPHEAKPNRTLPRVWLCGRLKNIIYLMRLIFKCKLILELTLQEGLLHGGFVTEIKSIGNSFIVPSLWTHLVFTVIAPIRMNLFDIHVALPHINRVSVIIHHPISIS